MSKFEKLNVSVREGKGTSFARRLRLENKVPAVLYHSGVEGTSLSVEKNELYKALKTGQFIFEIKVGDKEQFVLVKEVQYHPVTDEIIHVDFQQVKEDQKISLEVPLRTEGESEGVKLGGILVQLLNVVTINCKPSNVPEALSVDISDLEMNSSLFVKDIILPDDVEMVTAEDIAVVSVQEPKKEEEVVEEVSEEGEEPSEESTDEEQGEKSSADSGESEASSEDNAKPDEEAKE
jgi:large subunit ribosomal protein L25